MGSFMVIFGGQAFSLFGSRLVQFALVWWITETTGLASTLAFASIVAMLPQVLLGPFAGALVDRWNRKTVMMVSDSLIALVVVALALLYGAGAVRLWHVFLAMFIRSLGGAFQWPAMQATTTLMVNRESLSRVAGMNQSLQGLAAGTADPDHTPDRRSHRGARGGAPFLHQGSSAQP
jgi:DHA3 family macrolide efflux protein-like MFS transporter